MIPSPVSLFPSSRLQASMQNDLNTDLVALPNNPLVVKSEVGRCDTLSHMTHVEDENTTVTYSMWPI